jgi:hypothetical protein
MLDEDRLKKMLPGEVLLEVPIDQIIQKLGLGIAEAQFRLDQAAVRVATMLSQARVELHGADGKTSTKSLLELGFMPNFYHFAESEIEVRMTISMQVSEGGGGGFNMSGMPLNAEYHRKHQFDLNGSSLIRTKLLTVPAPALFLDLLKEQARSGGSMSANFPQGSVSGNDTPGSDTPENNNPSPGESQG